MKKTPMEKESNISLGGALILLALFAQTILKRSKCACMGGGYLSGSGGGGAGEGERVEGGNILHQTKKA